MGLPSTFLHFYNSSIQSKYIKVGKYLCKNSRCPSALLILTKQMEENYTTKILWVYGFSRLTFTYLFLFQAFFYVNFLSYSFRRHNNYWYGYMVIKFLCSKCNRTVAKNHKAVQCDICHKYINTYTYKKLQKDQSPWYCICNWQWCFK